MGLLIEGKPGSRYSKEKGWEAYVPIKLKRDNLLLTLAANEKMEGKDGCFYLYSKTGENLARCDFPSDHKYMIIYRDLVNVLDKSIKNQKAVEPQLFKEPMEITEKGYVLPNSEKRIVKTLGVKKDPFRDKVTER